MAAPTEKTAKDLSGEWFMNKTLSTDPDATLALQGIGWLTRKAIGLASVTQVVKQWTAIPEDNPSAGETAHISFDSIITGGIKGTTERRIVDYNWRGHTDHMFGTVKGRSRFITFEKIREEGAGDEGQDEEDLKWLEEGWESNEGEFVESFVRNEEKGWTARQVWGFGGVEGERRHVRRVVVRKGKEVQRMRLVYDYKGPLKA